MTLGNALRRVLLSSLDGAAITSLRVGMCLHEFSDIPGVQEDMIQLLLQIEAAPAHPARRARARACAWRCAAKAR